MSNKVWEKGTERELLILTIKQKKNNRPADTIRYSGKE